MTTTCPQVFLSYAGENEFEASLFQQVLENELGDLEAKVWAFHRDQAGDETRIASSIKDRVRESSAMIMLVSPDTLASGATQWMELAYADASDVPTFVLLHRMTFEDLKQRPGVPPLVLASQCTPAIRWTSVVPTLRARLTFKLKGST